MSEKQFTNVSIGMEEAYCDFSIIKVGDKIISDGIPTTDAIGICNLLNEQRGIIEEKNNVITLMGAFIKNNGFSIDDFNEWISKDWHNVGDK